MRGLHARRPAARAGRAPPGPAPVAGQRPGLGGLWLLLVPPACCGGPLLIAGLAAAGALAWGALGLGTGVLAAVTVLVIRRSRACRKPGMTGSSPEAGSRLPGGHRRDEHRERNAAAVAACTRVGPPV
jgi:hypothetical protein